MDKLLARLGLAICERLSRLCSTSDEEWALLEEVRLLLDSTALATSSIETRASAAGISNASLPAPQLSPEEIRYGCASRALNKCWDLVHSGDWKDVPMIHRSLYASSALSVVASELGLFQSEDIDASTPSRSRRLRGCLRTLDVALMLGTPEDRDNLLQSVGIIEQELAKLPDGPGVCDAKAIPRSPVSLPADPFLPPGTIAVPRLYSPSMATFYRDFMCYRVPQCAETGTGSVYGQQPTDMASLPIGDAAIIGRPVVITGAIDHWPALARWADPAYLLSVAGNRTVPVEVGGHYMSDAWGQSLMTLREFFAQHMAATSPLRNCADADQDLPPPGGDAPTVGGEPGSAASRAFGYLAQHPLFDQIPALRQDICEPDYCSLLPPSESPGDANGSQEPPPKRPRTYGADLASLRGMGVQATLKGESSTFGSETAADVAAGAGVSSSSSDDGTTLNAWLGPAGTVSCLHYDKPHNLLCQAVGWKRVILVDPRHSGRLYPHVGLMANTAQVDPEAHYRQRSDSEARCRQHGDLGAAAGEGSGCGSADADADGAAAPADALTSSNAVGASDESTGFPLFPGTPCYSAVLGPGDALYIPPRWWHHVRSLSTSFSVSFWWGS